MSRKISVYKKTYNYITNYTTGYYKNASTLSQNAGSLKHYFFRQDNKRDT